MPLSRANLPGILEAVKTLRAAIANSQDPKPIREAGELLRDRLCPSEKIYRYRMNSVCQDLRETDLPPEIAHPLRQLWERITQPLPLPWQEVVLRTECRDEWLLFLDEAVTLLGTEGPREASVGNCVRLVAQVWHLRFEGQTGEYPARGNMALGWLAKLLTSPKRTWTVAEIRGDPEGKLAGDALLRGEREIDDSGIKAIRERLVEIGDIRAETGGGSDVLDQEEEALLAALKRDDYGHQMTTMLKNAHHNIASQLRNFLNNKLAKDMPKLAAHLKAAIQLDYPHFGYTPPTGSASWEI